MRGHLKDKITDLTLEEVHLSEDEQIAGIIRKVKISSSGPCHVNLYSEADQFCQVGLMPEDGVDFYKAFQTIPAQQIFDFVVLQISSVSTKNLAKISSDCISALNAYEQLRGSTQLAFKACHCGPGL